MFCTKDCSGPLGNLFGGLDMVLLLGVGYRTGKYLAPENHAIYDKLAVYQGLVIWVKSFMPKVDVARGVVQSNLPLF